MGTTLHIKNMVCNRCIKVVQDEFNKLQLDVKSVELGIVDLHSEPSLEQLKEVRQVLKENGFELIDDKKGQLVDSIKTLIIEKIHHSAGFDESVNSSDYLAKTLGYDYSYLSKLFSSVEGITIEKYIISQKIEKAKELLAYNELSLKEIAWQLGYSSVQHLSGQFKKVTGLTPSHFKQLKDHRRKPLDEV
ncbi:AraC family transcriptional regulator [Carboxylicivirga taeanensis]|uniref:AraC family transcriptional regulator n=1 Tax=Carboxylicivirga taeanensis TaxID=1416875 RepID=UPI003F6DCFB3